MKSEVHFPLFTVAFEREEIEVKSWSPRKVPDEKWRHVDKKGHGHFWSKGELPTLELVKTGRQWVGDDYDGSYYDINEYRCKQCGEKIKPGETLDYAGQYVPGPTWVTVTIDNEVFRLTQEQYSQSIDGWLTCLREVGKR